MVTKKQLGWLFVAAGVLGATAVLLVDVLEAGNYAGIGPAQRLALVGAGALVLLGLSLLPLGDRPA